MQLGAHCFSREIEENGYPTRHTSADPVVIIPLRQVCSKARMGEYKNRASEGKSLAGRFSQMAIKKVRGFPPHIQIMLAIFEDADNCRRENNALRSILRKQGLSDRAIQGRVKRILKKPDHDETGAQVVKRACEESLKRWLDLDAQEGIAKIDLSGRPVQ